MVSNILILELRIAIFITLNIKVENKIFHIITSL